jgi:hypothetical protein
MNSKGTFFSSLIYVSSLTFCFSCSSVLAEPLAEKAGWGGGLSLLAGGHTQQSQFSVEDDNRRTADLNNSGKKSNRFIALPLVRLDYTVSDLQTQFFFGNSQDNVTKGQIALELGLVHSLGQNDRVTFALFPKLPFSGETWKDPFLTGQERQTTNEKAGGGRIKFEHAGDHSFDVQYAFAINRVDLEESGSSLAQLSSQLRAMLNRNAEFHRLNVNMNCPVNQGLILIPGLQVTTSDAQGEANDFAEGVFNLQSLYITEKHFFSATLGIGRKESKVENPVFNLPQNDRSLSLFALYKYAEPMGYKNWSILGLANWEKVDSTITFYNSQSAALGIGLGYTW